MTEPLDAAYVELRASGTQKTAAEIEVTLKEIEAEAKHTSEAIERDVTEMTDVIEAHLAEMEKIFTRTARQARKEWRETARALATDIALGAQVAQAEVDDAADHMVRDLERVERHADQVKRSFIEMALANVGANVSKGLSGISDVLTTVGGFVGGNPLISLLAVLSPAIYALAGSLYSLLGVLNVVPAGIAGLVAAIVPLIVAFQGMGEAVSALASGDIEKIDEALKNLTPSARAVATEIGGILKPLGDLRRAAQEAFFAPLVGNIRGLFFAMQNVLTGGLQVVASAWGNVLAQVAQLVSRPENVTVIGEVFSTVAKIISDSGPVITHFLNAIFEAIDAGLPFVERASAAFFRMVDGLASLIDESTKSGSFQNFIEEAFTTLKDLGALTVALGHLLGALFGNASDEGHNFLQTLTDIVQQLADFFNSVEGQRALQDFADLLPVVEALIAGTATALMFMASSFQATVEGAKIFWHWITEAWHAVVDFFTGVGDATSGAFTSIVDTVTGWVDAVVSFFTALPGRVWDALTSLPGLLVDAANTAFDNFFTAVGFGVGRFIRFMMDLPGQVWSIIQSLWNGAVDLTARGIEFIITQVSTLPGRMSAWVQQAWNFVVSAFRSGTEQASSFVTSLPGRVSDALVSLVNTLRSWGSAAQSWLYDTGRNIVQGMINGIVSMITSAIDTGKRAANDIIHGIKNGLGIKSPSKETFKIGVQTMEGYELGVRSRLPETADTTAAALTPPDVVSPTVTADAKTVAPGTNVVFGPGAVSVTFSGTVPTTEEARRTGRVVGQGIADQLAAAGVPRSDPRTV